MVHLTSSTVHAILLVLVGIGAVTDVREGKVYNSLTYPGIAAGILLNGLGEPAGIGWGPSALGFLIGFGALLIAYLAGGLGGGDVKLMGLVGAFLGPLATAHALLYTFLAGAIMAFALIVWKEGIGGVFVRLSQGFGKSSRNRTAGTAGDAEPGSESGDEGEARDAVGDPVDDPVDDPSALRLPFAVAALIGTAWVVVEQAAGQSLLDLIAGKAH